MVVLGGAWGAVAPHLLSPGNSDSPLLSSHPLRKAEKQSGKMLAKQKG